MADAAFMSFHVSELYLALSGGAFIITSDTVPQFLQLIQLNTINPHNISNLLKLNLYSLSDPL